MRLEKQERKNDEGNTFNKANTVNTGPTLSNKNSEKNNKSQIFCLTVVKRVIFLGIIQNPGRIQKTLSVLCNLCVND